MKRQSFDILKSQRKATDNGPKKGNQPMDIRQELIGPLAKQNEEKEEWNEGSIALLTIKKESPSKDVGMK